MMIMSDGVCLIFKTMNVLRVLSQEHLEEGKEQWDEEDWK